MNRIWFTSLRTRLLFLVLLAILPALGLIFYLVSEKRQLDVIEVQENELRLARLAVANQEQLIEGVHQLLISISRLPEVRRLDGKACSETFADLLIQYPYYSNIGIVSPEGLIFGSALPMDKKIYALDRTWFKRAVQFRTFSVGEYQVGRITGKPTINFSYPVMDNNKMKAVLFAALDLNWLNQIATKINLPSGSSMTMIDHAGVIIARYPDPEKWIGQTVPNLPVFQKILSEKKEGMNKGIGLDESVRLYAYTPISNIPQNQNVYVILSISEKMAFSKANQIFYKSIAGLCFVAVIVLVTTWIYSYFFILKPIKIMVKTAERISDGDLSVRTGISHVDGELNQLAKAFDQMAESLQQRELENTKAEVAIRQLNEALEQKVIERTKQLETLNQELETEIKERIEVEQTVKSARDYAENIVDSVQEALIVLNSELKVISANRSFYQIFRMTSEETVNRLVYEIGDGEWKIPKLQNLLENMITHNKSIQDIEIEYEFPQIGRKVLLLNARKIYRTGNIFHMILLMIADITDRKIAEDEITRFFGLSIDLLCIADFDGCFKQISSSWENTLGYNLYEMIGKPFIEFVHPDDRELTLRESGKLQTGLDTIAFVNRYRCKDGTYRWLSWNAHAYLEVELIYAVARDVTEQINAENQIKQLHEELKQYAVQLETTNKELESFSYSVSHDLRAPLRSIDGFSLALMEDYQDKLDNTAKDYLRRIRSATNRMGSLIDDLLNLSRVSRYEMNRREINLSQLAEKICSDMKSGDVDRNVQFIIQPGIQANADERLMNIVLENLLGNALKFTRNKDYATIEFGSRTENGNIIYFVKDDGAGFDMKYVDKIFGAFQRLHTRDEFEGTGIGLATVQRIIHRHGGQIYAEGDIGKGAVFSFTLS